MSLRALGVIKMDRQKDEFDPTVDKCEVLTVDMINQEISQITDIRDVLCFICEGSSLN